MTELFQGLATALGIAFGAACGYLALNTVTYKCPQKKKISDRRS